MRIPFVVAAVLALAPPLGAKDLTDLPLYQSLEDPAGQQPTRILVEEGVFHFGDSRSDRRMLQRSDLGITMYFVRVPGGVRALGQPIMFPDGTRKHFEWEDFRCSASASGTTNNIVCRRKSDGQLFHSTLVNGELVSFDMRCFDKLDRVCHYRLIGGRGIQPVHITER